MDPPTKWLTAISKHSEGGDPEVDVTVNNGSEDVREETGPTVKGAKPKAMHEEKIHRLLSEDEEWCKVVELAMQGWIITERCERDYSDKYFQNPPMQTGMCFFVYMSMFLKFVHPAPLSDCCNRCTWRHVTATSTLTEPVTLAGTSSTLHPAAPSDSSDESDDGGSVGSSPSQSKNHNNKQAWISDKTGRRVTAEC
jgi:hypothetical protein